MWTPAGLCPHPAASPGSHTPAMEQGPAPPSSPQPPQSPHLSSTCQGRRLWERNAAGKQDPFVGTEGNLTDFWVINKLELVSGDTVCWLVQQHPILLPLPRHEYFCFPSPDRPDSIPQRTICFKGLFPDKSLKNSPERLRQVLMAGSRSTDSSWGTI